MTINESIKGYKIHFSNKYKSSDQMTWPKFIVQSNKVAKLDNQYFHPEFFDKIMN